MCSPEFVWLVRAEMSRRGMLGKLGAATAAAAVATLPGGGARRAAAQATPAAATSHTFSTITDLTHVWGPDFPVFFGATSPTFEVLATAEKDGYYKMKLTYDEHTGTHMDSPAHFTVGGTTAEKLPVTQLLAPLVVVDISAKAAADPDAQGTADDLAAWEKAHGPIPAGAFVALHSGWEARLADPATFVNVDDSKVQHYPGWHPDAAKWLVEERDIAGAGVDTLSLDFGPSTDFASHLTFLPAGKFGLECLANLASVPPVGATLLVGGPKHANASGGPSRVFALL